MNRQHLKGAQLLLTSKNMEREKKRKMIIQRNFTTGHYPWRKHWRGWFLFGFIPVFIKQTGKD